MDPVSSQRIGSGGEPAYTDALQDIWHREVGHVYARVALIERAAAALAAGRLDEAQRAEAQRAAHMLAGAVGTFGFAQASRLAAELERELIEPEPASASGLSALATALRLELELDAEHSGG
jgi:HPt (histidine-containing phosphotransfer) domain-containing protein